MHHHNIKRNVQTLKRKKKPVLKQTLSSTSCLKPIINGSRLQSRELKRVKKGYMLFLLVLTCMGFPSVKLQILRQGKKSLPSCKCQAISDNQWLQLGIITPSDILSPHLQQSFSVSGARALTQLLCLSSTTQRKAQC